MQIRVMTYLDKLSHLQVITISCLLLLSVATLDHLTGAELSFSVFYLMPIALVAWYSRRSTGVLFSCTAALIWLLVDNASGHIYSNGLIPFWNTGVRLSFFLITTTLLAELKFRLKKEKNMAITDGLTGIFNARAFKELSSNLLDLSARYSHPFAIGYIDVDNFKAVNDNLGHSEGDRVLKVVADTLTRCARTTDVVGRLGGDEFAVFLPETELAGAQVIFNRIHEELLRASERGGWPIGFSVGVAVFISTPGNIDEALRLADGLMYRVKKTGKNNLMFEVQT